MESIPEGSEDKDLVHYKKINLFGESKVGKTSLVLLLKNYNNNNFELPGRPSNVSEISYENLPDLINQIDYFSFNITEDKSIDYNIYETSLSKYNTVKLNLDVLLEQSECIIIMWDYSDPDTFSNIENLIDSIDAYIKENNMNDIPTILIQNKMDKQLDQSVVSNPEEIENAIEKIKNKKKNLLHLKTCLLKKDEFPLIALDINRKINNNQNNNNNIINSVKFKCPIKKYLTKDIDGYIKKEMIISLLGESNTGKTSFLYYLEGKNIENIKSTIGIAETHIYGKIHGERIKIKIKDTAGQERFDSITKEFFQKSHGFLLFFDVTNKNARDRIERYLQKIEEENGSTEEIILIGNKIDDNENRKMSKKDEKEYANEKGIKYYECSTKYGINVFEILNEIVFISYNKYKENIKNNIKRNPSIIKREEPSIFSNIRISCC